MGCLGHKGVFWGERGVWWAKKKNVWGRTDVFGGEKGCRGYNGLFGVQMECFRVLLANRCVWG